MRALKIKTVHFSFLSLNRAKRQIGIEAKFSPKIDSSLKESKSFLERPATYLIHEQISQYEAVDEVALGAFSNTNFTNIIDLNTRDERGILTI